MMSHIMLKTYLRFLDCFLHLGNHFFKFKIAVAVVVEAVVVVVIWLRNKMRVRASHCRLLWFFRWTKNNLQMFSLLLLLLLLLLQEINFHSSTNSAIVFTTTILVIYSTIGMWFTKNNIFLYVRKIEMMI